MFSRRSTSRRRYSSITAAILLASFVLLLSQAFADATLFVTSVPACCRAHGRHASSMHAVCNGSSTDGTSFHSVREKCPYCPLAASSLSTTSFISGDRSDLVAWQSVARLTELPSAYLPVPRLDDSNPKRGPPTTAFSL
jgi:hypothetical protein